MADPTTPAAQPATPPTPSTSVSPSSQTPQQGGGQAPPPGGQAAPESGRSAAEQATADLAQQVLENTIDLEKDGDKVIEVIVDGQVRRYKLRDAAKKISLGDAGYKRMEEGAKLKRDAQQQTEALLAALNDLDEDPERFAASIEVVNRLRQKAGLKRIDFTKVAEGHLARLADLEAMSPEQRRVRELEMEVARLQRQGVDRQRAEEEARERAEQEEDHRAAQHAARKFEEDTKRVFGAKGLPHSHAMKARAAAHLFAGMEAGIDYHLDDVTAKVEEELVGDARAYYGGMEGARLVEALGKDIVEKVRQELVRQATRGGGTPRVPTVGTPPPAPGNGKPAAPQHAYYDSGDPDSWRRARGR